MFGPILRVSIYDVNIKKLKKRPELPIKKMPYKIYHKPDQLLFS